MPFSARFGAKNVLADRLLHQLKASMSVRVIGASYTDSKVDEMFIEGEKLSSSPTALSAMERLGWRVSFGSEGYDRANESIIKGLLPAQSLVSVFGPSGSFKSFLALSWCCHIAAGISWDGRRVEQGSVLYVAAEGGPGISKRIKAWENHYDLNLGNALGRLDQPAFPADEGHVQGVLDACSALSDVSGMPVKLIVFDTLARCFGGGDENSAKDMGALIKGCDQNRGATDATVLIVHHTGKDPERGARGSSALRAALDAELSVMREQSRSLVLTSTKMKDSETPPKAVYELFAHHLSFDPDGDAITSLALSDQGAKPACSDSGNRPLTKNQQIVIDEIIAADSAGKHPTYKLIREAVKAKGMDTKHYYRWVSDLIARGLLLRDGEILTLLSERGEETSINIQFTETKDVY